VASVGAISVNYATNEGSVAAGTDYTIAQGTLYWDDGNSLDKTFVVTIIDDNDFEGS
jgi:hypothetical protein